MAPPRDPGLALGFAVCQFVAWILLTAVLLTATLSKNIRRLPTWYGFLVSWIISCLCYLVLTISGQQFSAQDPSPGLCLFQASLIYGAPPFTVCTTLALVIQLWFNLTDVLKSTTVSAQTLHIRKICLLASPYAVFFIMTFVPLGLGLSNPKAVRRSGSGVYCIIDTGIPGRIGSVFVVSALLSNLVFQGLIGVVLYKNWNAFRGMGSDRNQSLAIFLRASFFTLFGIFVIIVGLTFVSSDGKGDKLQNIAIAMTPLVAVFVFGAQMDILQCWAFWNWRKADIEILQLAKTRTMSRSGGTVDTV